MLFLFIFSAILLMPPKESSQISLLILSKFKQINKFHEEQKLINLLKFA